MSGVKAFADALIVNASLTSIDVGFNGIIGDSAKELATVVLSKSTLETFCNIPIKQLRANELTELDLSGKGVGVPGALVLAELLPVGASVTEVLAFPEPSTPQCIRSNCVCVRHR